MDARRNDGAFGGLDFKIVVRDGGEGRKVYYVETPIVPDIATARRMCATMQRREMACFAATRNAPNSVEGRAATRNQVSSVSRPE